MVDIALDCIRRGWFVFPCKPRAKEPLVRGGFHAATNDREQILDWWTKWPDANVGIATGASGLSVLDIDTGLDGWEAVELFCTSNGIPADGFMVRTGRHPGFGVQLYFQGGGLKSIPWSHEGVSGDIRSATGYVVAAGCPTLAGLSTRPLWRPLSQVNRRSFGSFVRRPNQRPMRRTNGLRSIATQG